VALLGTERQALIGRLFAAGIETPEQLLQTSARALRMTPGIGEGRAGQVLRVLQAQGFDLAPDDAPKRATVLDDFGWLVESDTQQTDTVVITGEVING